MLSCHCHKHCIIPRRPAPMPSVNSRNVLCCFSFLDVVWVKGHCISVFMCQFCVFMEVVVLVLAISFSKVSTYYLIKIWLIFINNFFFCIFKGYLLLNKTWTCHWLLYSPNKMLRSGSTIVLQLVFTVVSGF